MSDKKRPILVTAGGTGGHVYPGLAVARALIEQDIPVVWMGTRKGLEARVIPEAGIEMAWLDVNGLRGKGLSTLLVAPVKLAKALVQSIAIMRKHRPAAVLGMGGFVAGPGGAVAALMGTPVVIHEQNAVAGLTNKLLSRLSKRILEGFPGAFKNANQSKVIAIGNPVRKDISAITAPVLRMANRTESVRLLIVGGSLGAQALNETVPKALAALAEDKRPIVRHQAGSGKHETTEKAYQAVGVSATITPFIEDMAEAYEWADLIICRAGALTIAEISAAGLASILVPYPYAVDDHQTANGRYLSDNNAAIMMQQTTFNKISLSESLEDLLNDREKLVAMSKRARALAKPHATTEVAAICAQLAGYDFDKAFVARAAVNEEEKV